MKSLELREQALAEEMIAVLQGKMTSDYAAGSTLRDAHPKCLGLLKAEFVVDDVASDATSVGVFAQPRRYPALVRFSNASGSVQSDQEKDFRGVAIKLLGVKGSRYSDAETSTQDFLLMNHPTMPFGTPKLFRDVVCYSVKWGPLVMALRLLLGGHSGALREVAAGRSNPNSLLGEHYWSTTPYRFGESRVKYQLRPLGVALESAPAAPLTDCYLTDDLVERLGSTGAEFEFGVQRFVDEQSTPLEDAAIEWTESDAPYQRLARLEIPAQPVDTTERWRLAEDLSFSPGHALAVHGPMGGLNRVRDLIYRRLSEFRHERDGKAILEPDAQTFDDLN